jgi:hypothetical protein
MARPPALLWAVPAFRPYVQPPLTAAAVRDAERYFGVRLPAGYLAMLAVQNGGYLRATWPDLPHRGLDGIGPTYPSLILDDAWWRAPGAAEEMWVPPGLALLIPFDGDGHWDLCFDYRVSGPHAEPAVTYLDVETEKEAPVADSFDAFLDGLVDELETTAFRIRADVSLDVFAQTFTAASGYEFEDAGNWDHGYRQLRARLDNGAWLWLSANRVPAGFDRDGTRVIATPQTALRLPTDPACHLVVECTPDATETTQAVLRAIGHWDG